MVLNVLDNKVIQIVVDYCREHRLDERSYLNFIEALRLPTSYLHLRLVAEALIGEYDRATRFIWLSNDEQFTAEKQIISNIALALKNTARHSQNMKGGYKEFSLAVLLLSRHPENMGFVSDIYSVLKIYAIRYSLELQVAEDGAASFNNMVTIIRRSFMKSSSKNYLVEDIYSDLNRFIALLSDKNVEIWEIPKLFIVWISNRIIYSSRIKKEVQILHTGISETEVSCTPKLFEKHVNVENATNISGKLTRYLRVKPKQSEEDDSIDEICEFTADPEHPVSLETAEQSLLYGNHLRTEERMLLSLRTNVLTAHELDIFVEACKYDLLSSDRAEAICSATLLFIFLTARNLDNLENLSIGPSLSTECEGIDSTRGIWRRKSVIMPNSVKPDLSQPMLFEHTDYVDLPLPMVLVSFLEKMVSAVTTWGQLLRIEEINDAQILSRLKVHMESIPRRNTFAQIRNTLFQQLATKTDPGYAAFVLATSEPITPTALYYKSASIEQLKQDYVTCLKASGLEANFHPQADATLVYTGSCVALDDSQLAVFFKRAYEDLYYLFDESSQTEQGIIDFLNELTCYTTVIFLASSGHRNRSEFQFEPALFNLELDMMILSDKAQYDDASIRFIPIAGIAKAALVSYVKTCRALAGKLSNYQLKHALLGKSMWLHGEVGEPILSMITESMVRAVSSDDIRRYFDKWGLKLPLNFFRHRLCSKLSEVFSGDSISWIMGHVGEGEHPFSLTSALTLTEISACRELVNQALEPLQISVWEAPTQRGLAALPNGKKTSGYIPDYLKVQRMTFRQRVKWVKELFQQFSHTLEPEHSLLDCLDEFMDHALDKALNLSNHDDTVSCIKILNRKIERLVTKAENPQEQNWRMPLSESLVALDSQFFCKGRKVRQLRSVLTQRVIQSGYSLEHRYALNEIVLSLLVQSAMHFRTPDFVKAFQSERVTLSGLHFFDYRDGDQIVRIYIDPITVGLIKRYPHFSEQMFSEKQFLKFTASLLQKEGIELPALAFSSLSEFSHHIAFYDNHLTEPALMRAFRLNKIDSRPLSHDALTRLLTSGVMPVERQLLQPQQSANYKKRHQPKSVQLQNERKFFNGLMARIRSKLLSPKSGVNIKSVVPVIWAEFVKSSSEAIGDLINHSEHLSDAAVAVLLLMVDVGKRPGRGRRDISLNTLTTYYSKICLPLLDVAQDQKVFELDEDELADLYTHVLDCRELKTRARHAEMLRDLHRCVEKYFYLPDINWFEIEPNIFKRDEKNVANILTAFDYEQVLELLLNDPYSDETTRLAQSVILILAYRCGLRRSEIKYRLHRDFETADGLLYVYSNHLYRLKTINANRRIPANLLLNDAEHQIVKKLIECSKRLDCSAKGRVFNVPDTEYSQLCARVIEAIVTVTQNEQARLHDCRHSFATYMCWSSLAQENSLLHLPVTHWCRQAPKKFLKDWLAVTTGQASSHSHKFLNTLSMVIGHSSPLTTLSHYIHELSRLNLEFQASYSENNRLVQNKSLGQWLEISQTNTRQISSRSEVSTHLSLMQKIMQSWQLPEVLQVNERSQPVLSEKAFKNQSMECWLDNLAQLRRLAFATVDATDEPSTLMNRLYELFENRQHAAPFDLISPFGQIRASRHIHSRVKRALTGSKIVSVLKHLSEKNVDLSTLNTGFGLLLDSYTGSDGFFITEPKLSGLAGLEHAGFVFIVKKSGIRNIGKSSKNGVYYQCQLKNIDISDVLYLISIILSV